MNLKLLKPIPYRNTEYMLWIREFACIVCGSQFTEAAHTGPHGLRTKASDFRCVPLCALHHRADGIGLDSIGPERFEEKYNIDIRETVLRFIEAWLGTGHTL